MALGLIQINAFCLHKKFFYPNVVVHSFYRKGDIFILASDYYIIVEYKSKLKFKNQKYINFKTNKNKNASIDMKNTLKLLVSIYFLTSIANTNMQINKKAIIVV